MDQLDRAPEVQATHDCKAPLERSDLPRARVATTSAKAYLDLLAEVGS
jgi:hypothetical protein